MTHERLQKLIAASGRCSRRQAEELIRSGRVRVNGRIARLGDKADPEEDHIKIDNRLLKAAEKKRYLLMYKPRRVMTTCNDPEERRTVLDILGNTFSERVYPVGRLDYHSEGLLLLMNDGELAARITHPKYGLIREYRVRIRGDLDDGELRRLRRGAHVDGVRVIPKAVQRERGTREGNSWWRIEVGEGRTHEVRELFFRIGHPVQRLRRTAIGPIRDDRIAPGQFRELTGSEVRNLEKAARKEKTRPGANRRDPRGPRGRTGKSGQTENTGRERRK